MKIRIDLKLLFFLVFFYLTRQIKIYLLVLGFVFLHELAHIIVGLILGLKPLQIEIMPFGFCIKFLPEKEDLNRKIRKANLVELKYIYIAIAGPILNLTIAAIFSYISLQSNSEFALLITYSNLLLFIFNLIPIYPLDGGRIIESILKINKGISKTEKQMEIITKTTIILLTIISSIAILYLKNIAILLIIIYLWLLTWKEKQRKYLIK